MNDTSSTAGARRRSGRARRRRSHSEGMASTLAAVDARLRRWRPRFDAGGVRRVAALRRRTALPRSPRASRSPIFVRTDRSAETTRQASDHDDREDAGADRDDPPVVELEQERQPEHDERAEHRAGQRRRPPIITIEHERRARSRVGKSLAFTVPTRSANTTPASAAMPPDTANGEQPRGARRTPRVAAAFSFSRRATKLRPRGDAEHVAGEPHADEQQHEREHEQRPVRSDRRGRAGRASGAASAGRSGASAEELALEQEQLGGVAERHGRRPRGRGP